MLACCENKQFGKRKMASPATSSSVVTPQSTVISGGTAVGGCGGAVGAGPLPPPAGAPGGNPMYMLQWHEHHASFFRSVLLTVHIMHVLSLKYVRLICWLRGNTCSTPISNYLFLNCIVIFEIESA